MSSREGLKVLNDTKLVLNDSLIVWDHLGNIQNLQMSPILQTSFLVWTFFSRSLQQDGSKHFQWVDITPNSIFKQCLQWFSSAASSGLLWFYALAPNNSSIALGSMQAAATSNSEHFSPRRCRATSRELCAGALRPSARRNHRARLPRRASRCCPLPSRRRHTVRRRRLSARRLLSQVRQLGHQFQLQCPVVALIHIRIPNMPKEI